MGLTQSVGINLMKVIYHSVLSVVALLLIFLITGYLYIEINRLFAIAGNLLMFSVWTSVLAKRKNINVVVVN